MAESNCPRASAISPAVRGRDGRATTEDRSVDLKLEEPARFALHAEPENQDVARRLEQVSAMRERGEVTLPTTVAQERATNPFVRASDVEEFARLRSEKDSFR